ncbi:MAG: GyrI-like domain-containing protein [Flavobacteriales bacterium]
MEYRLETLLPKKLTGNRLRMTFANNATPQLWRGFLPRRHEIQNTVGTEMYSVQQYNHTQFFAKFNPIKEFDKWATVEVSDFSKVPEGMETLELAGGLYAVFIYKGDASDAASFFQQLYGSWLPASEFELDDRPHFEILGEKYKNNDPSSEEEVWIPVRKK